MTSTTHTRPTGGGSHGQWFATIVGTLLREGIEHIVISPGSRSTPLVLHFLSAEKSGRAKLHPIIDERSAAFFALGLARVHLADSRRAKVALVCTSGTAAAHYLPAIMEARASAIPLLVLSADRPRELIGSGANQCADQLDLFGKQVVSFCHLGDPKSSERAKLGLDRNITACLAHAAGLHSEPGPVHLNVPAEKPLEEVAPLPPVAPSKTILPVQTVCPNAAGQLAERLLKSERPALVAGPASLRQHACAPLLRELRALIEMPLLSDLTSQLDGTPFLPAYDADFVLQLGRPPVDSSWEPWALGRPRVVIAEHHWPDPSLDAEQMLFAPITEALRALVNALKSRAVQNTTAINTTAHTETAINALLGTQKLNICETEDLTSSDTAHAAIAQVVTAELPSSMLLFAGNSLAVRHLDLYGKRRGLRVLHQRGVSGIDGLVAGAAGAAKASSGVLLFLGDVSLRHDIASLELHSKDQTSPLIVVVVNDDGGRVFERLPIADRISSEDFERLFATTNDSDFSKLASAFGAHYEAPRTPAELRGSIQHATERGGTSVIEIRVAASSAKHLHTRFLKTLESSGGEDRSDR